MSNFIHLQTVKSYIVVIDIDYSCFKHKGDFDVLLAGASSGTPVFVQRGEDLLLCVKERVEMKKGSDFKWKVNGRTNIVKFFGNNDPIIYDDYEGRVELYVQNYTLCLKNVQKADSGRYTAVVSGTFDRVVAEYKVTVLGKFLYDFKCCSTAAPCFKTLTPVHFPPQIQCLQLS